MRSRVRAPDRIASRMSPASAIAPSNVSTNTSPRRITASSLSRISAVKPPTRSTCGARPQPGAAHQRLAAQRGAGDDVGAAHGRLEVVDDRHRHAIGRERSGDRLGPRPRAVPQPDLRDRPDRGMGAHQMRRHGAGADHGQHPGLGPGQVGGGQRRGRGGAAGRQRGAVHHGERRAGRPVEQHVEALHRRAGP